MSQGSLPPDCARRFEYIRPLGQGGFATVCLARQRNIDRLVAVKILDPGQAQELDAVMRFIREARATASLSHPSIVGIFDFGIEAGVPWIALEYLDGQPLREILQKEVYLPFLDAIQIGIDIAGALEVAHAAGIIHRDIKPENVIQAGSGEFKVTDFGIATWNQPSAIKTESGLVLGTPEYLSPEAIEGQPPHPSMDLYALGITLYEVTTGHCPFRSPTLSDILVGHLRQLVPDPGIDRPDLPAGLRRILLRALEKDATLRFPSAVALKEELQMLQDSLRAVTPAGGIVAPPPSRPLETSSAKGTLMASSPHLALPRGRPAATQALEAPAPPPPKPPPTSPASRRGPWGLVLLALAAILLLLILRRESVAPPPTAPALTVAPGDAPRTALVSVTGVTPAGFHVELRSASGVPLTTAPLDGDGRARLHDLVTDRTYQVALVDDAGTQTASAELRTPPWMRVSRFMCTAASDGLLVDFNCDDHTPFAVEFRPVDGGRYHLEDRLPPARFFHRVIRGLGEQKTYEVRVIPENGWGGFAGGLHRTQAREDRKLYVETREKLRGKGAFVKVGEFRSQIFIPAGDLGPDYLHYFQQGSVDATFFADHDLFFRNVLDPQACEVYDRRLADVWTDLDDRQKADQLLNLSLCRQARAHDRALEMLASLEPDPSATGVTHIMSRIGAAMDPRRDPAEVRRIADFFGRAPWASGELIQDLYRLDFPGSLALFQKLLKSAPEVTEGRGQWQREAATLGLALGEDPGAIPVLEEMLGHPAMQDPSMQQLMLQSLAFLQDPPGEDRIDRRLIAELERPATHRGLPWSLLLRGTRGAIPGLRVWTEAPGLPGAMVADCLMVLAMLWDPALEELVLPRLEDPDPMIQRGALWAAGHRRSREAARLILERGLMRSDSSGVAVWVVGQVADPASAGALTQEIQQLKGEQHLAASMKMGLAFWALSRILSPDALRSTLEPYKGRFTTTRRVHDWLVKFPRSEGQRDFVIFPFVRFLATDIELWPEDTFQAEVRVNWRFRRSLEYQTGDGAIYPHDDQHPYHPLEPYAHVGPYDFGLPSNPEVQSTGRDRLRRLVLSPHGNTFWMPWPVPPEDTDGFALVRLRVHRGSASRD